MASSTANVLIVDDDETMRKLLAAILAREPRLAVATAKTGGEALEQIEVSPPAVIVLDMMLPDMSGLELIERLRERYGYAPPVIAMTAASPVLTPDAIIQNDEAVRQVLRKPVDQKQFLEVVRSLSLEEASA
ncbi:MAG: response regulator [Thermoanaerobaculia bacterium]